MKGLELPVNVMIILVLGMIILIAVIVLVYDGYKPSINSVDQTTAKNNACGVLTSLGCSVSTSSIVISNFDTNKDNILDNSDTLMSLCENFYSITDEGDCRTEICGC